MDKTTLVEKYIDDGKVLLEAIDKEEHKIDAALWFFNSEHERWRLVIASPYVKKEGPKKMYQHIQKILKKLNKKVDISLEDIQVMKPNEKLINSIRSVIRTGPGIKNIRFSNNVINNELIEDAYIYRMV